jgi:hypothetical protein
LSVLRETLAQYITFYRGERGVCTLLCSLATVLSCIDPSERIVTKSTKVGLLLTVLYIYSPSLWATHRKTEKERKLADGRGEGSGEELNNSTERKPGSLYSV